MAKSKDKGVREGVREGVRVRGERGSREESKLNEDQRIQNVHFEAQDASYQHRLAYENEAHEAAAHHLQSLPAPHQNWKQQQEDWEKK